MSRIPNYCAILKLLSPLLRLEMVHHGFRLEKNGKMKTYGKELERQKEETIVEIPYLFP